MSEHRFSLKGVLGWISGTVAVISLVLGVIALNSAVRDWRAARAAVDQLLAGADAALAAGDFRLARAGYEQATALDPSSPGLREGRTNFALEWLRSLPDDLRSGETLQELTASLYPNLYEGLEGKSDRERSVIWAHIGWAHHLAELGRANVELAPRVAANIGGIYDRASSLDADDFYTPLFRAYLYLDSGADIAAAEQEFGRAMALVAQIHGVQSPEYRWARAMTLLGSLNRIPPRQVGRVEDEEWGLLLLRNLNAARAAGDDPPEPHIIDEALDFYRMYARSDQGFTMLMDSLPVDEHRLTYEWLLASETGRRWLETESNQPYLLSIRAALLESSDPEGALSLYRDLSRFDWAPDELGRRIDDGIARLSGEQLPRTAEGLERRYVDAPIPAGADPYAFHLETLMNFDIASEPPNSIAGFEFFLATARSDAGADARVLADVTAVRERVLRDFRNMERDIAASGYTFANSRVDEIIATRNLLRTHRLVALVRLRNGLTDQALAELDDAFAVCHAWVPGWIFELRARALSKRNGPGDMTQATDYLASYIDAEIRYGGALDWRDLKTHADFATLRATRRYEELMRGR